MYKVPYSVNLCNEKRWGELLSPSCFEFSSSANGSCFKLAGVPAAKNVQIKNLACVFD